MSTLDCTLECSEYLGLHWRHRPFILREAGFQCIWLIMTNWWTQPPHIRSCKTKDHLPRILHRHTSLTFLTFSPFTVHTPPQTALIWIHLPSLCISHSTAAQHWYSATLMKWHIAFICVRVHVHVFVVVCSRNKGNESFVRVRGAEDLPWSGSVLCCAAVH